MLGGKSRKKQRGFNWLSFTSLDCVEVISSVVRIAEAVRVRRVVEGRLDVREGTSEVSDAGLRDGNDDFRFCGLNYTCNNRFGDGRCRISDGRDGDGFNSRGRLCNWGGFSYRLNCLNYGSGRNLRCFRGGRLNAVTIFICLVIDALRSSLSVVKPGIC